MAESFSSRVDSLRGNKFNHQSFYHSPSSSSSQPHVVFQDLDKDDGYKQSFEAISNSNSRNFVVDFSVSHAWAGSDLDADSILELVRRGGWPDESSTRWINVCQPAKQKALIEGLALHYDFSPRLLTMMSSDPISRRSPASSTHQSRSRVGEGSNRMDNTDVERGNKDSELASLYSNNPARSGNLYALLDEVWHYTSVEEARNYLCLGYNSIYALHSENGPFNKCSVQSRSPLPDCVRVWTWLVLCADKTVITIQEDIFPNSQGTLSDDEKTLLLRTKQNTFNVLKSLSQADVSNLATLPLLPIRKRLADGEDSEKQRDRDAPGLLFFFLFENWFNSYSLVTRRESRYERELQDIRGDMFKQPKLSQVDRLDQVGNELGTLKRHYKSYIRIIDRIVEIQSGAKLNSMDGSQFTLHFAGDGEESTRAVVRRSAIDTASIMGVDPGAAARARFVRLKDMISLYALSEVKDYLDMKQNLTDMNFQLIAIKESKDVERLTRVSLLITKATILFLPVSLMTSIFSAAFQDQSFTFQQYWIAFAVVMALSSLALVGFGVFSGTLETWQFFPVLAKASRRLQAYRQRRSTRRSDMA